MKKNAKKDAGRLPPPIKNMLHKFYSRFSSKPDTDRSKSNPWNSDTPVSYGEMWIGANECVRSIQQKISGDPEMHWLPYAINKYLGAALGATVSNKPKDEFRCLLLGSNEGHMERMLCEKGFAGEIVASDVAENALDRAKQKIETLGYRNVTYRVADLNKDTFTGKFDFIIAEGVLHHIQNIEACLQMLSSILQPDGFFILVEFEGSFRFQLPEPQVKWINAALGVIPKNLRPFPLEKNEASGFYPATTRENEVVYYVPPTEASIIEFDPSEAISGPELKRLIPILFDVVERKGYGGTLLSYLTGHFDFKRTNYDEYARSWLKVLIQIEDTLIQNRILDDDFVFYVLESKKAL